MLPIIIDIVRQRRQARRFAVQAVVFLAVLVVSDRLLGKFFTRGLERYFGLDRPAAVLCLGHSHTVLALDKEGLESSLGVPVAKYARQGANVGDRLAMLRHYLEVQPEGLKLIVYGVDALTFTDQGLSANSYQLFFPFMNRRSVREHLSRCPVSAGEYALRRVLAMSRFSEATVSVSIRGWLGDWSNYKRGQVDVERLQKQIATQDFRRIQFDDEAVSAFEETLRLATGRGIRVVLVLFPTIDIYNAAEPAKYDEAIRRLERYAADSPMIEFLNYNPEYSSRHELFYDHIHLNPAGQREVTRRLAGDLKQWTADRW